MHPANLACLVAAGFDCCSLANNHVLDWGYAGLEETLAAVQHTPIHMAGAGRNQAAAAAPAVIARPGIGRVLVFAFGTPTSGIPLTWAATADRAGVHVVPELSAAAVRALSTTVRDRKQPGDIAVASIHWGSNWGYTIPEQHIAFAHQLIDVAGIDLVHGHSAHHVLGIEVYRDKLILYGCGDFLNDYEGIRGYEAFRPDLGLLYRACLDVARGRLLRLELIPTQIRHLRVQRASAVDTHWLADVVHREGVRFGTRVQRHTDQTLTVHWRSQ
jgi:poly-gamma-glutamate synthesis protein (capsule biosynthesis protein)